MYTDYWELFAKSGSVEDYLKYKNNTRNQLLSEDLNEQSDNNCDWDSSQRNQNQRE